MVEYRLLCALLAMYEYVRLIHGVCVPVCMRKMMDRRHFLKVPILWDNYNAMKYFPGGSIDG